MNQHVTIVCSDNIDPDGLAAVKAACHPWVRDTLNVVMVIVTGRFTALGDTKQIHEWATRRMRGTMDNMGCRNIKVYKGHIPPFPGVPDELHMADELLDPRGYHDSKRPDGDFGDARRHIARLVQQGYTLNFIGAGPYGEMAELLEEFAGSCHLVSAQVGPYDAEPIGFNNLCHREGLQKVAASQEVEVLWNTTTTTKSKDAVFWDICELRALGIHPALLEICEKYAEGANLAARNEPLAPHDVHCTISLAAALGNSRCKDVISFKEAVTTGASNGKLKVTFGSGKPGMAKRFVAVKVDGPRFKQLFSTLCS